MTISTGTELAIEELAHNYLDYLEEEGESLSFEGFKQHIKDNIVGMWESGIKHSDDAHALGYYMCVDEEWVTIFANWDSVVAEAEARREKEKE